MAVSRYRQNLAPVRSSYIPEMFVPNFGAYAEILTGQQKAIDEADALGEKVPKHHQKDYEDVNKYMGGIRDKIDNLATVYAEQGIAAGNRQRKQLLREVARDWQPGGKADRFQQRLNAAQLEKKRIQETYKDDPRLADFYSSQIQLSPFDEMDAPNYGVSAPTMYRNYNTKELGEYFDKVIGNIKADQVVDGPYLDRNALRGVSFKDLIKTKKLKYVNWNKVAQVLGQATTDEIKMSEEMKGRAYGRGEGQGQVFKLTPEGKFDLTEDKKIQFADTTLGQLLEGYATGAAYQEQDVTSSTVSHSFAEKRALKELDKQDAFGNIILSQPRKLGQNMFGGTDSLMQIDGNTLRLKGSKKAKEQAYREAVRASSAPSDIIWNAITKEIPSYLSQLFGKDDKISLDDPKLANTINMLTAKGVLTPGMTDEQKTRALGEAISNDLAKPMSSAQITPLLSTNNDAKRYKEGLQKDFFGDLESGTPGIISNLTATNQSGEVVSGTRIWRKAVNSEKEPVLQGEVMAPQSLLPFGTRLFDVDGEEYTIEPFYGDKIKPEYIMNMEYRATYNTLNNYSVEEELPGLPAQVIEALPEESRKIIPQNEAIYKVERVPEGSNLYIKDAKGYIKLNESPIIFMDNARQ